MKNNRSLSGMESFSTSNLKLGGIHSSLSAVLEKDIFDVPFVMADTETTGLIASKDRVIEIGALKFSGSGEWKSKFHRYYDPGIRIPDDSAKIHGISNAVMQELVENNRASKMTYRGLSEFASYIEGCNLVAHNAKFDMGFLNAEANRLGVTLNPLRVIDTLPLSRLRFPRKKLSLDALCKAMKIDVSSRQDFHGALVDADLLARVFEAMLTEEHGDLFMESMQDSTPVHFAPALPLGARMPRSISSPTVEEMERHRTFMEQKIQMMA